MSIVSAVLQGPVPAAQPGRVAGGAGTVPHTRAAEGPVLLRRAPRPQQQNVVTRVNQLTTTPTKTRSYYSQYFQQDANSMIEQSQTYYTPREEFMLDFAAWFVAIAICAPCIITNSTSSGSAAATACFDDNLDFQNMDDLQNEALRREKEKEQEKQQQRDNNDNDHRNNDHNHVNKDDEENNK